MTLLTPILTVLCAIGTVKEPLEVVTTTAMVADITRQVAGEHADVQSLMRLLQQMLKSFSVRTSFSIAALCLKVEWQTHSSRRLAWARSCTQ